MKVTIRKMNPEGSVLHGGAIEVLLDGQKISNCAGLQLSIKPRGLGKLTLEVYPTELEIDQDVILDLQLMDGESVHLETKKE